MASVVDASVLVVLSSGDPRKPAAERQIRTWVETDEPLHAPALLRYEVANGLTRLVAAGVFPVEQIAAARPSVRNVPITYLTR
jgi:predicted nucleic acid-binding protein